MNFTTSTPDHCCMLLDFPGSSLQHWPLPALSLTVLNCLKITCAGAAVSTAAGGAVWSASAARSAVESQGACSVPGTDLSAFQQQPVSGLRCAAYVLPWLCLVPSHRLAWAHLRMLSAWPDTSLPGSSLLSNCFAASLSSASAPEVSQSSCPVTFDFCAYTKQALAMPATMRPGLSPMLGVHRCLEQTQRCLPC